MRLDVYLVENRFFASREQAKINVAKGHVLVNGNQARKVSQEVGPNDRIEILGGNYVKYVSRGGLKLEKALNEFGINCKGLSALDVGSSTGGFTHCLLLHGAEKVYAVDVGTQQLDNSLRADSRVISLESKNIKDIMPSDVGGQKFELVVADLSFVPLAKMMSHLAPFLNDSGKLVVLIKPQFEAGPKSTNRKGLVKKPEHHAQAIYNVINAAHSVGLQLNGLTFSPLIEPNKNIEYLALFERVSRNPLDYRQVIADAFSVLKMDQEPT